MEETLKKITERNSKDTSRNFKEKIKCCICKKEFEYDKRKHFYNPPSFCGQKCKEKCHKLKEKKRIIQKIKDTIPKKYQDIETDRDSKNLKGKSVFLNGAVGTGKTVVVASLAKEYIKEECRVLWISYPEFIMKLQNAYKKDTDKTPYEIAERTAKWPGILVIDDLGAEKLTEFVKQITYYIINHREQNKCLTLITSNYSLKDINRIIDPRIASRVAGLCHCIKLKGKDRRVK